MKGGSTRPFEVLTPRCINCKAQYSKKIVTNEIRLALTCSPQTEREHLMKAVGTLHFAPLYFALELFTEEALHSSFSLLRCTWITLFPFSKGTEAVLIFHSFCRREKKTNACGCTCLALLDFYEAKPKHILNSNCLI